MANGTASSPASPTAAVRESHPRRTWCLAPHDQGFVADLCGRLRVSPLLAQVLVARGHQRSDDALRFLEKKLAHLHDPELLPGVSQAADRIVEAIGARRRITIYGDYDVDGITATSLLWHCLQLVGANVDYYIPSRTEEGYGLNCEALRTLHAQEPSRMVVTVDCGITSVLEAALARELGLEMIVTDHHQPAESLPDALAVHPRLGDYPFGDLCGVGVAFKLAWAICARLGSDRRASPRMRDFLLQAVGLAAIGTIADVVPLAGENRVIVHYGLGSLKERASLGLKHLLAVCGLSEKATLQAEDIAFALAPRINAAGRLGQARLAVELLTTTQPDRAAQLAEYVDKLNKDRQTVERRIYKQAKELVEQHPHWQDAPGLVLAHAEWNPGVIGVVASRVAEHFERPCILISMQGPKPGIGQGSGRTFGSFNLHQAIAGCEDLLVGFGGHHAAAGLKIAHEQIELFRERFAAEVASANFDPCSGRALNIDAEVRLCDLSPQAIVDLEQLGPFGAANRRPVFVSSQVELAAPPKKMGEGERHLSLLVRQHGTTLRAVAFGRGEWADEMAQVDGPLTVCYQPVLNHFRGQTKAELQLIDWRGGHRVDPPPQ